MRSLISQMSKSSGNSKAHKGKGVLGRCGAAITGLLCAGLLGGMASAQTSPNTYCTAVFSVGPYSSYNGQIQVYSPDSKSLMTVSTKTISNPNAAAINGNNGWLYYADQDTLQMYVYKPDTDQIVSLGYTLRNEGGSLIGASFDPTSQYYYVYFSSGRIARYSVSGTTITYQASYYVTDSYGYYAFRQGTNGDIVINSSGQAYIIGEDGYGNSMVGTINLSSGVVTNLKYLSYNGYYETGINGLAYDPTSGTYYVSDQGTMYTLNVSTGAMSLVTSQNSSYDLASCAGSKPNPPTITKSFSPSSVALPSSGSAVSRLTITIGNSNSSAIYLTSDLVDQLPNTPGAMKIASTPNLGGTCPNLSSYVVATAGSTSLTVKSGERIPSGGCTISVDVSAPVAGTYTNTIQAAALKTTAGSNAAATSATLTVTPSTSTASTDLGVTKTANVSTAQAGDTIKYTVKVKNLGPTGLTQAQASGTITLTDTLPAGTTLATMPVSASTYFDWDCSASVIGGNVVQCTTKMGAWPVGYENGISYTVNVNGTATGTLTNKVQVNYPADTNTSNNTAQTNVTVPTPTPVSCTNMYALVVTDIAYDYYGTPIKWYGGKIQLLDETTNTLTGTAITLPNGATGASLAISPDGTKFFVADENYVLNIYNTTSKTWTTGGTFSGAGSRIVRMGMTPSGIGYAMDSNSNLWSFTQSGTVTYLGTVTSTSTSSPSFNINGDFYATADGKLYMLSSQTGGSVDLWFLDPNTLKAEYLGNLTDANTAVQYNGLAATPNGVFAANTSGTLGKVDVVNVTMTSVGGKTTGSTDLASCYYPSYAPQIDGVKSVKKVAGSTGTDIRAGDTLEYTIVVRNSGTLPAGGSTFSDPLPAGTTYVPNSATVNGFTTTTLNGTSVNLGGTTYPFAKPVGICSMSTTSCTNQVLKIDSTPNTIDNEAVIKFRVTVNSGTTSVSNVGIVNYNDGGTPPTDIPTNPVVTPVTPPVELAIVKTSNATNGAWTIGQSGATYTLTVTNKGATATSGVITVKDLLPTGLTYNGNVTAPSGWTCSVSGQVLTCTTSNVLASGASVNITVPVNVVSTGTLTNKAVVGGGGDPDPIPDPATCVPGSTNPNNQCASVPVTVSGTPTLNVTKTVQKVGGSTGTTVYPGDILEYTIQVRNTGSVDATGVTFQDVLPNGTTYVADSAKINGFNVTITNGTPTSLSGTTYPFASAVGICSTSSAACSTQTIKVDTTPATLDNEAIIVFRVKVADPFTLTPSQVSNQAVVTYPGGPTGGTPSDDPTTTTPNDPTITPVVKPAKLTAVKTVQNITAGTAPSTTGEGKPGDTLEYCITTTNVGSANATKITFGDTVPSNTNFLYAGYGTNQDIKMTTSSGKISYFTAALDADYGSLNNGRVTVSDPNFVLTPQQSFTVCFRTTIK